METWILFADDDCGNLFAVSNVGHIAFWDHETGKITKIADSFDEFAAYCTKNDDVELEEGQVLYPRQGYVVPGGVVHRTRAPEKTVVIMVQTVEIVPTGDAEPGT